MKIEVVSQVTYCVDDLKKVLKYEDLNEELTNKFMLSGAQEPKSDEVSDES